MRLEEQPIAFTQSQQNLFDEISALNRIAVRQYFEDADSFIDTDPPGYADDGYYFQELLVEARERRKCTTRMRITTDYGEQIVLFGGEDPTYGLVPHDSLWERWQRSYLSRPNAPSVQEHVVQQRHYKALNIRAARSYRIAMRQKDIEHGPATPAEKIAHAAAQLNCGHLNFAMMNRQDVRLWGWRVLRVLWVLADPLPLTNTRLRWLKTWDRGEFSPHDRKMDILIRDCEKGRISRYYSSLEILHKNPEEWVRVGTAALLALKRMGLVPLLPMSENETLPEIDALPLSAVQKRVFSRVAWLVVNHCEQFTEAMNEINRDYSPVAWKASNPDSSLDRARLEALDCAVRTIAVDHGPAGDGAKHHAAKILSIAMLLTYPPGSRFFEGYARWHWDGAAYLVLVKGPVGRLGRANVLFDHSGEFDAMKNVRHILTVHGDMEQPLDALLRAAIRSLKMFGVSVADLEGDAVIAKMRAVGAQPIGKNDNASKDEAAANLSTLVNETPPIETPQMQSTGEVRRSWTQSEVDAEIRRLKSHTSFYPTLVKGVQRGDQTSQSKAKIFFGRNALARKLKAPKAMISKSEPWMAIRTELKLERKTGSLKKVGFDIAVENSAQAAGDTVAKAVAKKETVQMMRDHLPSLAADELLQKLENGETTNDQAQAIVRLYIESKHTD